MSGSSIRVRVSFSFKGETHELETSVDLDRCLAESPDEEPNFHLLLARAGGIDSYSYLYEVLESHELEFFEPTGSARDCYSDGHFDWSRFVRQRDVDRDLATVAEIANRLLGIADLGAHAEIRTALLAAYRAGKAARRD